MFQAKNFISYLLKSVSQASLIGFFAAIFLKAFAAFENCLLFVEPSCSLRLVILLFYDDELFFCIQLDNKT